MNKKPSPFFILGTRHIHRITISTQWTKWDDKDGTQLGHVKANTLSGVLSLRSKPVFFLSIFIHPYFWMIPNIVLPLVSGENFLLLCFPLNTYHNVRSYLREMALHSFLFIFVFFRASRERKGIHRSGTTGDVVPILSTFFLFPPYIWKVKKALDATKGVWMLPGQLILRLSIQHLWISL